MVAKKNRLLRMSREVVHMVWFKAPNVTDERFEAALEASKNLNKIPGVISSEFGLYS